MGRGGGGLAIGQYNCMEFWLEQKKTYFKDANLTYGSLIDQV